MAVNELGCGYGALFKFLLDAGFRVTCFTGYDISVAMLEAARRFLEDERVELIHAESVTREADYSFASGIFNVKFDTSETAWRAHVERTLHNLNDRSKKGFAFNLLSNYVDYREDHLFYGDPCYYFDFCKRHFSKKVSLLHDYDLWEWTMIIDKP